MHLNTEMLRLSSGIELQPIAYKGVPPGMPDLLTGRLAFAMSPMSVARGHVASGSLRALAVASPTRVRDLPDVPTFAEADTMLKQQTVRWEQALKKIKIDKE